jgi:hypothetical protein
MLRSSQNVPESATMSETLTHPCNAQLIDDRGCPAARPERVRYVSAAMGRACSAAEAASIVRVLRDHTEALQRAGLRFPDLPEPVEPVVLNTCAARR